MCFSGVIALNGEKGKPVFLPPPGMTMSFFLFMLRDQSPQIALFGFSLLRTSAGFQDDEFFSNAPRTQRPTDATGLQLSLFKQTFPRSLELLY